MADEDPDFDALERQIDEFASPSESESEAESSESAIEPAASSVPRPKRQRLGRERVPAEERPESSKRVDRQFALDDVHRTLMQEQRQSTESLFERLAAMNDDGDIVHLRSNTIVQSVGHVQALPVTRGQRYYDGADDDDDEDEEEDDEDESSLEADGGPTSVAAIFRELCIEETPITDEVALLLRAIK